MRGLLPLALLGVLSACTAQAPGGPEPVSKAPNVSPPPTLFGAWRSSIDVTSGAFTAAKGLEFMYVFHNDGTLTESSNYDAAPPVPPAYGVFRFVPGERTVWEAKYSFSRPRRHRPRRPRPWPAGCRRDAASSPSGSPSRPMARPSRRQSAMSSSSAATGAAIAGGGEATGRGVRIDF